MARGVPVSGRALASTPKAEQVQWWSVASMSHRRGLTVEPFRTEAEATARFAKLLMRSRVLFSPTGEPLRFQNAPRLSSGGEGEVASILRAMQEQSGSSDGEDFHTIRRVLPSADTSSGDARADGVDGADGAEGGGAAAPAPPADRHGSDDDRASAGPRDWGRFTQWAMKPVCRIGFNRATVSYFGAAPLRLRSLCYFDVARCPRVRGRVALTFDDAPCRQGAGQSELRNVLEVLGRFDARATFMTVGAFVDGHEEDLVRLLRLGHELGNHGMQDRPYHKDSQEDFAGHVDGCSSRIRALQREAGVEEGVKWFRAPHGKYTREMASTLEARGLTNVMCDTYASCPIIQDGEFIGDFLARNAQHGSIILIHMPEKNFRGWCGVALGRLLEGLQKRGLQAVTVSELSALATDAATATDAAATETPPAGRL